MNIDNILEYQRKVIKYANSSNKKSLLLYHSLQDNTILTSLLLSLTIYNKLKVKNSSILIVCSSLNIQRYINYIRVLKLDIKVFEFLNYKQFNFLVNENKNYCKNKVVVIDKVHYYRNPSILTHNIIENLSNSLYNLLISSIIFINGTDDIISIIAILHRVSWDTAKEMYLEARDNKSAFTKLFEGYISYHSLTPSEEKKNLKIYENIIELPYTDKDLLEYIPIENWFLTQKADGEYRQTIKKKKVESRTKKKKESPIEKRTNLRKFILDFKTTVNNKVKDENKIAWVLNKITTQFQEKKTKTIIYFSQDSDKIHFMNEFNKYNLQYINVSGNMSYESQKSTIQRFNKSKIYILIMSDINADMSWFIPHIRNLIIFEPQIDNSKVFSLKDDLINSYKYSKDKSSKKSTSDKRLDIFTLVSKKPKKTRGVLTFVKDLFIENKAESIDELIQDKNEKSKLPIKIYKKQLKAISI